MNIFNKAKNSADMMQAMPKIMAAATALMSGNKDALMKTAGEFLTPDKIAEAAQSITGWFIAKQGERGEHNQYRVVLFPDTENKNVVLSIYALNTETQETERVFNKALTDFTDVEIKTLLDAILTSIFPAQQ